jgi:uncharacterized membrane protein
MTPGALQRRDLAIGVIVGIVLALILPGLGVVATVAIVVLAVVGVSYGIGRLRRRQ